MDILNLNDDCLQALIAQVLPEDLLSFAQCCLRLFTLADARLSEHRELIAQYSILDLNSYQKFSHEFGKPTLRVKHPMELLLFVEQYPTVASYIRVLYYCEYCDNSWFDPQAPPNPQIAAREIAKDHGEFEHTLATLGIVKGAATFPSLDRDFCEIFMEMLRDGDLMWTLALLLLHCRQLSHIKAVEHADELHNWRLLERIFTTYESIATPKTETLTSAQSEATSDMRLASTTVTAHHPPRALDNLTKFYFAQGSHGDHPLQPCLRFFFTRPKIAYLQLGGFTHLYTKDIDVSRQEGDYRDEDDPRWSDSPHPWRDFCWCIATHPTLETLDLRGNRDFDMKELSILLEAILASKRPMAASKLHSIIYSNGYDDEWERNRFPSVADLEEPKPSRPMTRDVYRELKKDNEKVLETEGWKFSELRGDYPQEYFEIRRRKDRGGIFGMMRVRLLAKVYNLWDGIVERTPGKGRV